MIKFACAKCGKTISAADEHAGRKARCPMCQTIQVIPAANAAPARPAPQPPRPTAKAPPRTPRPAPPPTVQARKPAPKPAEDELEEVEFELVEEAQEEPEEEFEVIEEAEEEPAEDFEVVEEAEEEPDEEEEERPRRRPKRRRKRRRWHGQWADCPNCGAPGDATRLHWTIWGGFIGPLIICHVRCNECGATYNGNSGDSNTGRIAIYIAVNVGLALVIVCGAIGVAILGAAAGH